VTPNNGNSVTPNKHTVSFVIPIGLTPYSRILEKLIIGKLVKKCSIYGTQMFITVYTTAPALPILIQINPSHTLFLQVAF
jgi:hypothetical protein